MTKRIYTYPVAYGIISQNFGPAPKPVLLYPLNKPTDSVRRGGEILSHAPIYLRVFFVVGPDSVSLHTFCFRMLAGDLERDAAPSLFNSTYTATVHTHTSIRR